MSTEATENKTTDNPLPEALGENPSDKELLSQYEKKIYDLQQLLEISRSLCTTLELPTLIESVLYITMAQMRVLGAGIFVLESLDSNMYGCKF